VHEQFGRPVPTVERLDPLSQYQSPYDAYRTITHADSPAGEDLTLPLGAPHRSAAQLRLLE
jgi:hypothetical protein